MKKNKIKLVVSSLIILLPALFGVIVWNQLPQQLAIHFGVDGTVDGFGSRLCVVALMPVIFLALHLVGIFFTRCDNKENGQSEKALNLVYWILPVLSLYVATIMYALAFGAKLDLYALSAIVMGAGFIVMGNYMPKCKRNRTIGVKIKWTLASDENWNYIHRLVGKTWVIGGVIMVLVAFLPLKPAIVALVSLVLFFAIIPIVASYLYYKKQLREGTLAKEEAQAMQKKSGKPQGAARVALIVAVLAILAVVMFTGTIRVNYQEETVIIEMSYHKNATIPYEHIESIEYREHFEKGGRVMGYGSPKVSMGTFTNDEFGNYTLYAYTGCDAAVVLVVNGKKVAINGSSTEETLAIYEALAERIGG